MSAMKKNNIFLCLASALALTFATACSDACEYLDTDTDNPSFVKGYEEGSEVGHPESLASTKWVRGNGLKYNAYGEEIKVMLISYLTPFIKFKHRNDLKKYISDNVKLTKKYFGI